MRRTHYKPHRIKPKKSIFKKLVFWLVFLLSFLIVGGIYFFIFFETFQISKIIILGNEKVQTKELENLVSEGVKQKLWFVNFQNILLVSPAKINQSILKQYPNINSIETKRKLPNVLVINIKERKPSAIFCNKTDCFFIDENGVVFEKIPGVRDGFLIVRQFEEKKIILGKEIVKKEIMEKIAKIKKDLKEKFQINVKEAIISSEERLDIKTSENWEIYFNLVIDIDLQIEKLNLLLEKEIPKESRAGLKYIDLRFKDRAYYK